MYPIGHVDGQEGACFNGGDGCYDQIKKAFQDIVAPELHALRGEIRVLDQKFIIALDQKIDAVESRLTIRIDALAAQIASA